MAPKSPQKAASDVCPAPGFPAVDTVFRSASQASPGASSGWWNSYGKFIWMQ